MTVFPEAWHHDYDDGLGWLQYTGEQGAIHRVSSPYYGQAWSQRHRHAARKLCVKENTASHA
jgi:hypothetical protein